jgi:hypothetical protein
LTGSWVGGKSDFTQVKCAVGWSNYPFIIANILGFLVLLSKPNVWLSASLSLINLIVIIWSVIIFLKILGEAMRISAWKALLAVLIAAVLVFVVMIIIALLIPLLSPLFK